MKYKLCNFQHDWKFPSTLQKPFPNKNASRDTRDISVIYLFTLQFICKLCQQVDNEERVVEYMSRSLRQGERKWHAGELEALALLVAITKWRDYLWGGEPFVVRTDASNLQWLLNSPAPRNNRLERWAMLLEGYSFKIVPKPGTQNANADALSRAPLPNNTQRARTISIWPSSIEQSNN